jgi:hypothetical protein
MSLTLTIRSVVIFAALLIAQVASPQIPAALSRPNDLTVSILTGGDPRQASLVLPLGSISYFGNPSQPRRKGSLQSFTVSKHIRVRVARNDGAPGKASMIPYLLRECDRCTVRVDGVVLTTMPGGAGRIVPLNSVIDHVIDIEIKRTAPAGELGTEVAWQVEES